MSDLPLSIVDTCIAQASGDKIAGPSGMARDILLAIQETGLNVAFSSELQAEWKVHASKFSKGWLVGMYARRRVKRAKLDTKEFAEIVYSIAKASATDSQKLEMEKDVHLIILANQQQSFILTFEKNAVELYLRFLVKPLLKSGSAWVRTSNDHAKCLKWVRSKYRSDLPARAVILAADV